MPRQAAAAPPAWLHACTNLTKISAFHLALSWGLSRAPARSQQTQTLAIIRAIRHSLIKGPELKLTVILDKQLC